MPGYSEFETEVKGLNMEFEKWQHLLPAIPYKLRQRYIDALTAGWDMPRAFDIVQISIHLTDEAFAMMLAERSRGNKDH